MRNGNNIANQETILTGITMSGMSCIAISAPNNYFLKYGTMLGYGLSLMTRLSFRE